MAQHSIVANVYPSVGWLESLEGPEVLEVNSEVVRAGRHPARRERFDSFAHLPGKR